MHVGQDGVTDSVIESVVEAFNTRELFKLRVLDTAPQDPRATADQIMSRISHVEVPQTVGRSVLLYRPDPEDPEIKLPRTTPAGPSRSPIPRTGSGPEKR